MRRVGIFAGTFDPIHSGHIAFALAAAEVAQLDTVVFLPEPKPRNKTKLSSIQDRVAMIKLAIHNYKNLAQLSIDQDKFRVKETLPLLLSHYPGAKLYLLIGSDVMTFLPKWPQADRLLKNVTIIAARRGEEELQNSELAAHIIHTNFKDISSSEVRKHKGLKHISPEVADYIKKKKLY